MTLHSLLPNLRPIPRDVPVVRDPHAQAVWDRRDRRIQWLLFAALGGLLLETWLRIDGILPSPWTEIMFGSIIAASMAATVGLAVTGPRIEIPVAELEERLDDVTDDVTQDVVTARLYELSAATASAVAEQDTASRAA